MRYRISAFLDRTPLRSVKRWLIDKKLRRDEANWEKNGRPAPPPHAIKQRTLKRFAQDYDLKILVETGTFYGRMVEAMKGSFRRIYSIELSPELHKKAIKRFQGQQNIELIQGDSGAELGNLIHRIDQPALFWLDGHYSAGVTAKGDKDTPIYEELTHIFDGDDIGHVIVIDDARCFGTDPAYPSLSDLSEFVRSKRSNVVIEVADDSIRITPARIAA